MSFSYDIDSILDLLYQTADKSMEYTLFHAYPRVIKKFHVRLMRKIRLELVLYQKNELMLLFLFYVYRSIESKIIDINLSTIPHNLTITHPQMHRVPHLHTQK